LPVTIADWAATEARFKQHFTEAAPASWNDEMIPFHEYLTLPAGDREGRTPYILALAKDRTLRRLTVSVEIVRLAEERQQFWSQLRQLAGLEVAPSVRDLVAASLEAEFEARSATLRAEYETRLTELKASYPAQMARRLATALLAKAGGSAAVAELLAELPAAAGNGDAAVASVAPVPVPAAVVTASAPAAPPAPVPPVADDETMVLEAWIDSIRCTTCNECTNLNKKLFAYNADKQAYIKDLKAGTFQQLVVAAERCPVAIIHPGTPLNPKEKDLEKWVARAAKFN